MTHFIGLGNNNIENFLEGVLSFHLGQRITGHGRKSTHRVPINMAPNKLTCHWLGGEVW